MPTQQFMTCRHKAFPVGTQNSADILLNISCTASEITCRTCYVCTVEMGRWTSLHTCHIPVTWECVKNHVASPGAHLYKRKSILSSETCETCVLCEHAPSHLVCTSTAHYNSCNDVVSLKNVAPHDTWEQIYAWTHNHKWHMSDSFDHEWAHADFWHSWTWT